NVEQAAGQRVLIDLEWTVGNAVDVERGLLRDRDTLRLHFTVQANQKVVDVQIVLEKYVVFEISQILRPQRIQQDLDARHIRRDELQDFRPDMKVAKDQVIRIGTHEVL